MNKIFFVDTETTGLDPKINGIHQIAGQIIIDGKMVAEIDYKFKPLPTEKIEPEALAVSGLTIEEVMARPLDSFTVYKKVDALLATHVNRYDKHDKMVIAGYNCNFDAGFINEWFQKHRNKYFFGLCHGGAYLDGLNMALLLEIKTGKRIFIPDRKLKTVAQALGIPLDNAHDALADIQATRDVIKTLWKRLGL